MLTTIIKTNPIFISSLLWCMIPYFILLQHCNWIFFFSFRVHVASFVQSFLCSKKHWFSSDDDDDDEIWFCPFELLNYKLLSPFFRTIVWSLAFFFLEEKGNSIKNMCVCICMCVGTLDRPDNRRINESKKGEKTWLRFVKSTQCARFTFLSIGVYEHRQRPWNRI